MRNTAMRNIDIEKIIDIDMFISVQSKLSNIVNFSVVTTRPDGRPVREWSNFTSFCQLIRSSAKGSKNCIECDRKAYQRALKLDRPIVYDCHCGLKDCAAPIVVDNLQVGCVLGGQVLVDEADRAKIDVDRISQEFDLPREKVEETKMQIAVVPQSHLEECIDFYNFLSNYAAQMGANQIAQRKLLAETQEKMRLQNYSKNLELKQLQSQLNPHFLFNALNTVARMAMIENAPNTERIIYNLSDYLRYNIKNAEEKPKIRSEVENIRRYLDIQKLRYSDRLDYSIDVDEDILDCRILSMTMLPIVENSIIHGLETKAEGGFIQIEGKKAADNKIEISVTDNGLGFSEEVLLMFANHQEGLEQRFGIGLLGTHQRLRLIYGEQYGLNINSVPNVRTCVKFLIPLEYV